MSINRLLWTKSFQERNVPNWICPTCQKGVLRPFGNGIQFQLTAKSFQDSKDTRYWDYSNADLRYSLLLECDNGNCKEHVASCGNGYVTDDDFHGKHDIRYIEAFEPEYFSPNLLIFPITSKCPELVRLEIESSFRVFFVDPSSAANHIRKSIENILTDKRVKQYSTSTGGRRRINLHDRIVIYGKKNPLASEKLLAIKWLGNEGSHGNVTKDDVLDTYEILEKIIDDLYEQKEKSINKKVVLINKTKKPIKRVR